MAEQKDVALHFKIVPRYSEHPTMIDFINHVRFTHVNFEVFMEVGATNDQELLKIIKAGTKGAEVEFMVKKRYGMTVIAFAQLRANVDQIWEKLREGNILKKLGLEED